MTSTKTNNSNPLTVHSTFRNLNGQPVRPYGLQWHMAGESNVSYTAKSPEDAQRLRDIDWTNDKMAHRWLVDAHNRWCFARDWPFRTVQDIAKVSWKMDMPTTNTHLEVEWKPIGSNVKETRYTIQQIDGLLRMDKSAKGEEPPSEVWMNGMFIGMLQPESLDGIIEAVLEIPSRKVVFRKSRSIIRIERRFGGRIIGQEIFEHLLDNLYAMEDPQIVDATTLIGTATLPDWIMGGELTSRLWVQEMENGNILTFRPLYNDSVDTADRKYMLKKGKEDDKIAKVKEEMDRLRYLATLPSPFEETKVKEEEEKKEASSPRELMHRRNRRRIFGM